MPPFTVPIFFFFFKEKEVLLIPFDLQEALICTARDLGKLHGKRGARAPPQPCAVLGSLPCGGGGPGLLPGSDSLPEVFNYFSCI